MPAEDMASYTKLKEASIVRPQRDPALPGTPDPKGETRGPCYTCYQMGHYKQECPLMERNLNWVAVSAQALPKPATYRQCPSWPAEDNSLAGQFGVDDLGPPPPRGTTSAGMGICFLLALPNPMDANHLDTAQLYKPIPQPEPGPNRGPTLAAVVREDVPDFATLL